MRAGRYCAKAALLKSKKEKRLRASRALQLQPLKKNKPWQKKYYLGEKDIFALLLLTHFFRSITRIVAHHMAVTHFNCCLSRQEKASTCYQLASLAVEV